MEKIIIKSVINVIKYLAALYGAVLVFNHVNAWAGIAIALVVIVAAIINIIKLISKNQEKMKKYLNMMILAIIAVVSMTSCERVAPNYAGVLMENYGKAGKEDFSIVVGKVWTAAPGTELFQVPLFDQRGQFDEDSHLKAADNTEFTVKPMYSYKVLKNRAIDVVFDNKHIGSGDDFMTSVEDIQTLQLPIPNRPKNHRLWAG